VKSARLYLVAPSGFAGGRLASFVSDLVAAGVDIVQLREKEMEAGDVLRVGAPVAAACTEAGIPFIVNDRPDVALALGADGVHLGQNDIPVWVARRILPEALVGRSTHTTKQIDDVVESVDAIDYLAVGPIYETPTKEGRPAVGHHLIRYAAGRADIPWFAIGGIDEVNIDAVMEAGARRIVVVRAITEARDPVDAAARLRAKLDTVPL
jgi:thiamine-phosphate pyrophosphorylase